MSGESRIAFRPGSFPALRVALFFAAGIVAGNMVTISGEHLLPACLILFAVVTFCLMLLVLKSRSTFFSGLHSQAVSAVYLLCISGTGFIHFHNQSQSADPEELLLRHFDSSDLVFHGSVLSDRATRTGNRMLRIEIDSVRIHELPTWHVSFKTEALMRSGVYDASADKESPVTAGRYIHFRGDLRQPNKPTNPNQFDYAAFLARQNIYTQIFITSLEDSYPDPGSAFWLKRQIHIQSAISRLFSEDNAPLARAIILGDRSDLDAELRTAFSRAGLAHLMAVSGMHVGFILLPVWFVLPWFRKSGYLKCIGLTAGGLLLLTYAGITGFSISVSRASLMAFFLMLARLFHKPGTSMNILGAAAFILLLIDPLFLFDVGFQLSFAAVMIILTTLPGTRFMLPKKHRYRYTGALFQFVMVSVLVQGGLYPVLMIYFNEFSVAGPLSNTLAVPFVQFMFLWSFIALGISFLEPAAGILLNMPGDWILSGLTGYVRYIGSHPSSWIEGTAGSVWIFGIWFFAVCLLASLRMPGLRWKMAAGVLVFLLLIRAEAAVNHFRTPALSLTFFDVGQGDAVLMQTPGGLNYLYDTGVWTPSYDSAERTLLTELKARGISRLDGIILSHPHADHIGGIVTLMENVAIDTIYQSPVKYESRLYHRYMKLAGEKQIPVRLLQTGDMITTDPSMPMLVLAPSDDITARDANNMSVAVQVHYGESVLLLSGDAEKEAEAFMVSRFGDFLKSDLLKIGHHASRTSSTASFLDRVGATKGAASLALNNRYGHPHEEAARRLQNAGVHTRYTSLQGAVKFRSCGKRFRHIDWRAGPAFP